LTIKDSRVQIGISKEEKLEYHHAYVHGILTLHHSARCSGSPTSFQVTPSHLPVLLDQLVIVVKRGKTEKQGASYHRFINKRIYPEKGKYLMLFQNGCNYIWFVNWVFQ
jgi:hypothetical protein